MEIRRVASLTEEAILVSMREKRGVLSLSLLTRTVLDISTRRGLVRRRCRESRTRQSFARSRERLLYIRGNERKGKKAEERGERLGKEKDSGVVSRNISGLEGRVHGAQGLHGHEFIPRSAISICYLANVSGCLANVFRHQPFRLDRATAYVSEISLPVGIPVSSSLSLSLPLSVNRRKRDRAERSDSLATKSKRCSRDRAKTSACSRRVSKGVCKRAADRVCVHAFTRQMFT